MNYKRQAHGLICVRGSVYAIAGLTSGGQSFDKCERYQADKKSWQGDVPDFPESIFSVSFLKVDYVWIYGFGGANDYSMPDKTHKVFRLNTSIVV